MLVVLVCLFRITCCVCVLLLLSLLCVGVFVCLFSSCVCCCVFWLVFYVVQLFCVCLIVVHGLCSFLFCC